MLRTMPPNSSATANHLNKRIATSALRLHTLAQHAASRDICKKARCALLLAQPRLRTVRKPESFGSTAHCEMKPAASSSVARMSHVTSRRATAPLLPAAGPAAVARWRQSWRVKPSRAGPRASATMCRGRARRAPAQRSSICARLLITCTRGVV